LQQKPTDCSRRDLIDAWSFTLRTRSSDTLLVALSLPERTNMRITFIKNLGADQLGDTREVIDGIAAQYIAEGKAVVAAPDLATELRAIADRRKPKIPAGNRKLSSSEIRALYGRTFQGIAFGAGRPIQILK
jgi:hypothetical protein